jgi:hypothetical protein
MTYDRYERTKRIFPLIMLVIGIGMIAGNIFFIFRSSEGLPVLRVSGLILSLPIMGIAEFGMRRDKKYGSVTGIVLAIMYGIMFNIPNLIYALLMFSLSIVLLKFLLDNTDQNGNVMSGERSDKYKSQTNIDKIRSERKQNRYSNPTSYVGNDFQQNREPVSFGGGMKGNTGNKFK